MKVIAINNNKGGSGKTTTVANLAAIMAEDGKKVLIIDADNQSNISLAFGIDPDENLKASLYDVLTFRAEPKDAIINIAKNIDLIPSNDDLVAFDFEVIGNQDKYIQPFKLMKISMEVIVDEYDYILIDTPPSLSLMVGNAFTFADHVIIPFNPEKFTKRSLMKVLDTMIDFQEIHNPNLRLGGVLATIVARTTIHTAVLQETRQYCYENDIKMFDSVIPRATNIPSAFYYENRPAALSKKYKNAASTYYDVYEEIKGAVTV